MTAPHASAMRNAVPWSFVMSIGQIVLSSITLFVLAAVVGPAAFGTIALALVLVLFLKLLLEQGMGAAIIQREDLQREHLDAAFWMVMGLSVLFVIIGAALAPWWATLNNEPDLRDVVWALLLMLPIRGLIVTQDAVLRRDMRFKALAARTNLGVVIGGGAGVVAALTGAGVWALVIQQLIMATTELLVLWTASDFRPRFDFSRSHARDLLGFSAGSLASSLGLYVQGRADELSMGIFFGTTALGLYRLAYRVMNMVADVVARALAPVSLSELSRLQNDRKRFTQRVVATIALAVTVSYPAMAVLAACAPSLTRLLGPEWDSATVPMQLLCIEGMAITTTFLVGPVLQALGRPHHQAILVWITAAVSTVAYFGGGYLLRDASIDQQVIGLTLVNIGLFAFLTAAVNMIIICRVTGTPFARIRRRMIAPSITGLGALAAGLVSSALLEPRVPAIVQLAGTAAVAGSVALALLLMTSSKVRTAANQLRARDAHLAMDTMLELNEPVGEPSR